MSTTSLLRVPVHVEVEIKSTCSRKSSEVEAMVLEVLQQRCPLFSDNLAVALPAESDLIHLVNSIRICDLGSRTVSSWLVF